jgi:hypothetical protein
LSISKKEATFDLEKKKRVGGGHLSDNLKQKKVQNRRLAIGLILEDTYLQ